MVINKLRHWLGLQPPILAVSIIAHELRYMVTQGLRVVTQGVLSLPEAINDDGIISPAVVRQQLLRVLPQLSGNVAILLPSRRLHLHQMSLPAGLDSDEFEYQIHQHITHNLGLSLADVFYDWQIIPDAMDKNHLDLTLGIARQMDLAPFYHIFSHSNWRIHWVCAAEQVWANLYYPKHQTERVAVCQVEAHEINFTVIEAQGRTRTFYKRLDDQSRRQAGFVFHADAQGGALFLPVRYVADELNAILPTWLEGARQQGGLDVLYVTGKGMDWTRELTAFQSHIGVPVRLCEHEHSRSSSLFGEAEPVHEGMVAIYQLTQQVQT